MVTKLQSGTRKSAMVGPRTAGAIVERLTGLEHGPGWVVSCYLKLEPRDRARGKYLIKLKNRVKQHLEVVDNTDGFSRIDRRTIEEDLDRVRDYLQAPTNLPVGQGIAVFASKPRRLFEAIPLPRVFRSRLAVDQGPLVREIAALDDEYGLVIAALYDRTGARFFRVSAFDVEELTGVVAGDIGRAGRFHARSVPTRGGRAVGAHGEHNYHQRIRAEKHRHYANIAQELFDLARSVPVRGVVLAGVGSTAGAVEPHLHPYVREQVLGTARLNPKTATTREVMDAVHEVRRGKEREWEIEHLKRLEEGLGARWAVNGIEPSLRALSRGQVRTLLVDPAASVPGHRCLATGRLTVAKGGCRGEGTAERTPDVIDEAIEEALRQTCHVDVVEGDPSRIDGLAALFRFKQ